MTPADGPARTVPLGRVATGVLTTLGVLGLVVVLMGVGGAVGPSATPIAGSPTPLHTSSPVATPTGPPSSADPTRDPDTDASAIPVDDPLLSGLLTEADLPGLASPLGAQEGTDFDIDTHAFEANEGIRVVSRSWQSLADSGLAAVFDFRMQFPTEEAAAAYLAAAEPILSEAAANGQSPVPSASTIGSDSRVYGLETSGDGGPVLLRTYLFRVGPVAAKVVAGGPGVDATTTDALAATAALRILAAGPPAPGSPRPAASPTAVPVPTEPLPTGEALAALLLEHVPPEFGSTCVPDAQRLWPGELATLACTDVDAGVTVTYSGFDSADSVEAAFDASLETIDLSQLASSCDQGTYIGPYQLEDEEIGRLACWAEQGGPAIMWSDDRLAILAVAASSALDPAGLYLWWLGAGPIL